jgi:hypothetical protein
VDHFGRSADVIAWRRDRTATASTTPASRS